MTNKLREIKALSKLTHLEVKNVLGGENRNSLKNSIFEGEEDKLKQYILIIRFDR
jgi:hypothetical protein